MELNPQSASGKFQFAKGFDFESVLAKLSETNTHINGWSIAE